MGSKCRESRRGQGSIHVAAHGIRRPWRFGLKKKALFWVCV